MPHKDWGNVNHISVIIVSFLSFLGAVFNVKRYCLINKEKCDKYSKSRLIFLIISHIVFDAVSVGTISLIVYIGMVGYGFNEFLSVAVAGFLGAEGNSAIYQFKLLVAEKLGANTLLQELQKEKEAKK